MAFRFGKWHIYVGDPEYYEPTNFWPHGIIVECWYCKNRGDCMNSADYKEMPCRGDGVVSICQFARDKFYQDVWMNYRFWEWRFNIWEWFRCRFMRRVFVISYTGDLIETLPNGDVYCLEYEKYAQPPDHLPF